ncbi:helix-turn-helix transcriptional regulator [Xenorhabdus sp. PB30.3]|uniref:helix-turn-helix domain-containing protein n=1 Tax=Xenorhabdus sp. PB30.3 TaxID=2788941 RepID=UPI001E3D90AD|nr:helix-turn-helix transcriptional regulator [Xenorhabdus sp. PB30.3]MCC8380804.1 helix-turn-helix transcriptional regulator [Xenorhabdus sp. PB30.3]
MTLSIGEKILLMRESERLTNRKDAADLIGITNNALWRYETGEAIPKGDMIMKILSHPKFEKYILWFVTDKSAPEVGQIVPVLYDPKNYENDQEKSA